MPNPAPPVEASPADVAAATSAAAARSLKHARGPLLAFVAFGIYAGCWAALAPAIKQHAHASAADLAIALLCAGFASLPAMKLAGRASDRFGDGTVGISLAALGVALLLCVHSTSPLLLDLSLVLLGFVGGATDITMNAAVAHAEAATRPLMNLAHALFAIGAVAGAALTGVARDGGVSTPMIAGIFLLVVVLIALDNRSGSGRPTAPGRNQLGQTTGNLLGLGVLVAISFAIEASAFNWGAIHVEETFHSSPAMGGFAISIFYLGSAAGRLGAHARGHHVHDKALLMGSGALVFLGGLAVAFAPSAALVVGAFALLGLGTAVVVPTLYARAGAFARRGAAISTVASLGFVGGLLGPSGTGFIASASSLRVSFAILACGGVALLIGAMLLFRTGRED